MTLADAHGDVLCGLQVVETAIAVTSNIVGEKLEVSKDMDTYVRKLPLGPFLHIPALPLTFLFIIIPLWTIPLATVTGNTLILKPSERDPGAAKITAELCAHAGLPEGIVNAVHGTAPVVNRICDHGAIKAVSFVGGRLSRKTYTRGEATKKSKRAQANLSVKNYAIIPDANKNLALNSIIGAAFGAAGQKCMEVSVAVLVGAAQSWLPELVKRASKLNWPLISPASKARVTGLIAPCADEGGRIHLDGRNIQVPGYSAGNFVGPTVLEGTVGMRCYREEIFGPVLTVTTSDTLDDALDIINENKYGNARKFESGVHVGQVNINVLIPVALPSLRKQ
ncbi:Aldehyde/histidinol dehydrogenase [Suillus occidentalis]|nr:Aldehyde/histidinol dehydrogenase [Suillus occidentalis]